MNAHGPCRVVVGEFAQHDPVRAGLPDDERVVATTPHSASGGRRSRARGAPRRRGDRGRGLARAFRFARRGHGRCQDEREHGDDPQGAKLVAKITHAQGDARTPAATPRLFGSGPEGRPGVAGTNGATGPAGSPGQSGAKGDPGVPGTAADRGDPGPTGPIGATGPITPGPSLLPSRRSSAARAGTANYPARSDCRDLTRSPTEAQHQRPPVLGGRRLLGATLRGAAGREPLARQLEARGGVAGGVESVVPDLDVTGRQYVLNEAGEQLVAGQGGSYHPMADFPEPSLTVISYGCGQYPHLHDLVFGS